MLSARPRPSSSPSTPKRASTATISVANDLGEFPDEEILPISMPTSTWMSPRELEFRKRIRGAIISHCWDAFSMFVGTVAWMGIYYAQPKFGDIDDNGYFSYILHSIAMGVIANAIVIPSDYLGQRSKGDESWEAIAALKKYFLLYTVPDVLYEPCADFVIAISKPEFYDHFEFDFEQYSNSSFSPTEITVAFFLFCVIFGLVFWGGDLLVQYLFPGPEEYEEDDEELTVNDAYANRVMRATRDVLESPFVYALKSAIQYFVFYLTDMIFDVEWESFEATAPQLIGVCGMMAGYSLIVDCFPEFLHLIERAMYPPHEPLTYRETAIEVSSNQRPQGQLENSFQRITRIYDQRRASIVVDEESSPVSGYGSTSSRLFIAKKDLKSDDDEKKMVASTAVLPRKSSQ